MITKARNFDFVSMTSSPFIFLRNDRNRFLIVVLIANFFSIPKSYTTVTFLSVDPEHCRNFTQFFDRLNAVFNKPIILQCLFNNMCCFICGVRYTDRIIQNSERRIFHDTIKIIRYHALSRHNPPEVLDLS